MIGLWVRFEQVFPGNWDRRFRDKADSLRAMNVWAEALAGYDESEFKRGVNAIVKLKFPPSCGEFAALCRPVSDAPRTHLAQNLRDPDIRRMHEQHRLALPAPGAEYKSPQEHLASMRDLLRGKPKSIEVQQ